MGRIKGFFCSFCLNRVPDQSTNDRSFSQGIDVSHLATPHVPSNQSLTLRSSSNPSSDCQTTDESDYNHYDRQPSSDNVDNHQGASELRERRDASDQETTASSSPPFQSQEANQQPSPSSLNAFIPQSSLSRLQQEPQSQQNHLTLNNNLSQPHQQLHQQQSHQQQPVAVNQSGSELSALTPKLSYDIISVREPLAKILAERQQAQQQQRLILGDHEYIEVYGERGSSCFYEEIAGSTTSSATYDQIGVPLNHNYQAIMNAYAVATRHSNDSQSSERPSVSQSQNVDGPNDNKDYGTEHSVDRVDQAKESPSHNPTTSSHHQTNHDNHSTSRQNSAFNERGENPSQSIPVYSVINKATRRSNATIANSRPPQPPPKNLVMNHQPSTSAIQNYQTTSLINSLRNSPQFATTSSLQSSSNNNSISESNEGASHFHSRLPQPPPRYSKHPTYNAASRPLPLPHNSENSNNNGLIDHSRPKDEDLESINNGYELLNSNFDDDQIDVGYERIRETSRYSGGSLSSQFCPLQALDNGGYESVQPIYSSPSNALAEPNYEAIGPATASELAAAATARLKAIEFLKQDRQGG